jgi:hypothetical protein
MTDYSLYQRDPAMLYETFLRRVYHCGRGDDPFGLANTDMYSRDENDMLNIHTVVGIWTAMQLLRTQVNDVKQKDTIHKMIRLFEKNPTNKYFIRVSKEIFKLLETCEINEFPQDDSLPYKKY